MIDPNLIFRLTATAMAVEQFLKEEYDTDFTFPQAIRFAQFEEYFSANKNSADE